MKQLSYFINEAAEGRTKYSKKADREVIDDPKLKSEFGEIELIDQDELDDKEIRKIIKQKAARASHTTGKDEKRWTKGGAEWAIEPPFDDDAVEPIPEDDYNQNLIDLEDKITSKRPFFILGRAGWGKTSIIKDMAKRAGRHIITVYLDKAQATDLGGIPVPIKENGVAKVVNAMPDWAAYMLEHENDKFLLFFDEMNQAQPDVMNALMPIVLDNVICNIKFYNFIVGAAGNFEDENEYGVSALSGPLKSRFKPIIVWSSGTEDDWKSVFKYLHKKWDPVFGKNVVDEFEKRAMLFENPRELENEIFVSIQTKRQEFEKNPKRVRLSIYKADWCLHKLEGLVKEELTREQKNQVKELAEIYHKLLVEGPEAFNNNSNVSSRSRRSKGADQVSEDIKNMIKQAMKRGYIMNDEKDSSGKLIDKRKYGISRENINIFCDSESSEEAINAEMLERLINKFEADGIKFKYETNEDWKKAGLSDPYED